MDRIQFQHVIPWMAGVLIAVGGAAYAEGPALPEEPPGPHFELTAETHETLESFRRGDPLLVTTYFYWYSVTTGEHITHADGSDALTTHPAEMDGLCYMDPDWHYGELRDMMDAGLDVALPVYWGVPGEYDEWSFTGLPPLVEAHDRILEEGKTPPQIGLFYDTSILRHNAFHEDGSSLHVDMSTAYGQEWFYTAMRDFFSLIPPDKWARVDGKPLVVLYGANWAADQAEEQFAHVRERFKEDFGTDFFLVGMRDWIGDLDAAYQWGGALGLELDPEVAALGPGYDHSAVPGREPLVMEREDGRFYVDQWSKLLALHPDRRPWMVHVETWNEWHEGTDIADSREFGRQYIVLTDLFARLWREGVRLPLDGPYADREAVEWTPAEADGLALRESEGDGVWGIEDIEGAEAAVSQPSPAADGRYLYFVVDESFAYDLDGVTTEAEVTYRDAGAEAIGIQYDNLDPDVGAVSGAFRDSGTTALTGSGDWRTATFELPESRFIGRANSADFRIYPEGGEQELAVKRVRVRYAE
ncbi:MAG: DUF5010 domain-containing protein [Candidatus Hydrogenedentota bacterium]